MYGRCRTRLPRIAPLLLPLVVCAGIAAAGPETVPPSPLGQRVDLSVLLAISRDEPVQFTLRSGVISKGQFQGLGRDPDYASRYRTWLATSVGGRGFPVPGDTVTLEMKDGRLVTGAFAGFVPGGVELGMAVEDPAHAMYFWNAWSGLTGPARVPLASDSLAALDREEALPCVTAALLRTKEEIRAVPVDQIVSTGPWNAPTVKRGAGVAAVPLGILAFLAMVGVAMASIFE